jgi:pikromycin synthase
VDELEHDPYPLFARLREREPVTWFDALDAWIVTSREHALLVARNPADFTVEHPRMSVRALLSSNMLTVDGTAHAYHRGPFSRPFRLAEVRTAFESYLSEEVAALVGSFVADGEAELRSRLAGPLACKTIAAVLGLPTHDVQLPCSWYDAFADAMTQFATAGALPPEGPATYAAFRALVEQHLNDGGLDRSLLERVQTTEGGGLAADDLISDAALLMFGGIETTESMILNAAWFLLSNPDQLRRLETRGDLLDNAIEESLRLEAAVASFERFATRRTELGQAEIDAGDAVVIMAGAANPRSQLLLRPRHLRHHAAEREAPPRFRCRTARLPGNAPRAPRGPNRRRRPPARDPGPRARPEEERTAAGNRLPEAAAPHRDVEFTRVSRACAAVSSQAIVRARE